MDTVNYVERFLHTDEPVLFETNALMDKKHTEDFNIFSYTKRNRAIFIASLIFGALSFLGALASAAFGELSDGFISMLCGILCIGLPFMNIKKSASDSMKNGYHYGNINNYKFYQEYFVNTDFFTISIIPYNIVVDAHETDEYFFLYISKHQAHVIPKYSFVINTPEEMRKMLSIKLANRFIVHCR